MASTNPARGMRDFLPADVRKRNYVIGIIKEVYESYGFEPLETPAVENLETLIGKYGEEGNQLIFKVLKRGEKLDLANASKESDLSDLALRYDLTVPLARFVANNKNELPKFFKRYQIQPVWRADRPARGRFREFYQCDVDAVGSDSMAVEAELISAVSRILERLGFDDFVIRINHRKLLLEILEAVEIPPEKHPDALSSLDKLDKIGHEGVVKEFRDKGIASDASQTLITFLESVVKSDVKETIGKAPTAKLVELKKSLAIQEAKISKNRGLPDALSEVSRDLTAIIDSISKFEDSLDLESPQPFETEKLVSSSARIDEGSVRVRTLLAKAGNLARLQSLLDFFAKNGKDQSAGFDYLMNLIDLILPLPHSSSLDQTSPTASHRVVVDPTLARGLSYYTGTIMEINVPDLAGSLGGGGRYDGLIGMFGKEQIPACGFSLGLERILVVMEERGMFPPEIAESTPADVMVTIWSDETIGESLKLASELRAAGIRTTVYPEADKLGKQFKYADSIKVPWVCVIGESEIAGNQVTLKNLSTGEQNTYARAEIASKII